MLEAVTRAHAIPSCRVSGRVGADPGGPRAWIHSADGVADRAPAAAARAALAVSPPPPAHVRRGGGPRAGRTHAPQRRAAREGTPRLPVRRLARDRKDLDGEDPCRLPELRARANRRTVRAVRL